MKFEDINRKFTEKIGEFISRGFLVNAGTMAGSEGEIAKVDFTDGKDIYRVLMDRKVNVFMDGTMSSVRIIVGKSTDGVQPNGYSSFCDIWNHSLEIISSENFYEVGSCKNGEKFYGTKEEAEAAERKRQERCVPSDCRMEDVGDPRAVAAGIRYVKRKRGLKKVNPKDVEVKRFIYDNGKKRYKVNYRNHGCITLH